MRYLVTGATGFVGGHVAEACVRRGQDVSIIAMVDERCQPDGKARRLASTAAI